VAKQYLRDGYFGHHPKRQKKDTMARKKLRTIENSVVREKENCQNIFKNDTNLNSVITKKHSYKSEIAKKRFACNPHDSKILEESLHQSERVRKYIGGTRPKIAGIDRGFGG
jgi:hypothetical protein